MRDSVEAIVLTIFILSLVFLFKGNPSVWDTLHDRAVAALKGGAA